MPHNENAEGNSNEDSIDHRVKQIDGHNFISKETSRNLLHLLGRYHYRERGEIRRLQPQVLPSMHLKVGQRDGEFLPAMQM